jgi:hypothetical protein
MDMAHDTAALAASPVDCPACAAHGTWHPGRQAVVCPACGTVIDGVAASPPPDDGVDFFPLLRDRPDSGRDWRPGATQVRCAACGASMAYPAYLAGRACEACGSPSLLPCDATGAPVHPSGVVPFALSEADARDRFAAWVESKRTIGLRRRRVAITSVRAVYLPCWTFSARVRIPWRGEIEKTNRDGETERRAISGTFDASWQDLLVPASASVPADLVQEIEPFLASDLAGYHTRYLAGHEVEVYAVNLWDAWDAADARMQREVESGLRDDAGISPDSLETWPEWSGRRCRHVLVPIYAIDYSWGDERFVALVNGRTGAAAGRSPTDALALLIGLVILVAGIGALVLLAFLAWRSLS